MKGESRKPQRLPAPVGRSLASLLRYKFLHEYGYGKGAVVVQAIVEDICKVVRGYYARPEDLEPGQLIYHAPPSPSGRAGARPWPRRSSCPYG